MDTKALFQIAPGLRPPWEVETIDFQPQGGEARERLDIQLTFPRGSRFPCPTCGESCPAHDTHEQRWRHMDCFQHEAYLVARVPRTSCKVHGVFAAMVPWARDGSGFPLLFVTFVMLMAAEMPMRALARALGEHDTRLWRVVQAHVAEARERGDMSEVKELIVDETSQAKGTSTSPSSSSRDGRRPASCSWPTGARTRRSTTSRLISGRTGGDPPRSRTSAWT